MTRNRDDLGWLLYHDGFSVTSERINEVLTAYRGGGGLGPVVAVAIWTDKHSTVRVGHSYHYLPR